MKRLRFNNAPRAFQFALHASCLVFLFSGCDGRPDGEQVYLSLEIGESVRTERGLAGRSIYKFSNGDCIVFHYPPVAFNPALPSDSEMGAEERAFDEEVAELLKAGGRYIELADKWGGDSAENGALTTFNCASYALGDLLGLAAGDWLNGEETRLTRGKSPLRVVLDAAFRQVAEVSVSKIDWSHPDQSLEFDDGDLICFTRETGRGAEYIHVGIARIENGVELMESKLGRGPVVMASLGTTARLYGLTSEFTDIRVYRRR